MTCGVVVAAGVAAKCSQRPPSPRTSPSSPIRSSRSRGKSSAPSAAGERRSAAAVRWSAPGARPRPRSMRPGCSASSAAICSATTRAGWLGSMMPPEPTRMVFVRAARWAINTGGDVLATDGMLWCSATQNRRYPSASARWARAVASASAFAVVPPSTTMARSRTDSGGRRLRLFVHR